MKPFLNSNTQWSVLIPMMAILATPAFAASDKKKDQQPGESAEHHESTEHSMQNGESDMRQVSGKITKVKQVEVRGTNTKNTVVMIKTKKNNRRLVVDLGPTKAIPADQIKVGKTIEVEGRPVEVRDQKFIVASRMKTNGKMMNIERPAQEKQHSQSGGKKSESDSQMMSS